MDKDKNIINVSSYNQSGGITAYKVHVTSPARHLTPEVVSQLESLSPDNSSSKTITISAILGNQEAFNFASEIRKYLLDKEKEVCGVNQVVYSEPLFGQFINKKSEKEIEIIIGSQS